MTAIGSLNISSSTATNWLKEAQEYLLAAENPGGMMGALQNSKYAPGSLKAFLVNGQKTVASLVLISQSSLDAARDLAFQMANEAIEKRVAERLNASLGQVKSQTNYNPPTTLDPVIYFADGASLDTDSNILTRSDGKQIDVTSGKEYIDEQSVIRMANGAYLDTKNNILTLANGTKIDTVTGLNITT
jgi:hypothetical protein